MKIKSKAEINFILSLGIKSNVDYFLINDFIRYNKRNQKIDRIFSTGKERYNKLKLKISDLKLGYFTSYNHYLSFIKPFADTPNFYFFKGNLIFFKHKKINEILFYKENNVNEGIKKVKNNYPVIFLFHIEHIFNNPAINNAIITYENFVFLFYNYIKENFFYEKLYLKKKKDNSITIIS